MNITLYPLHDYNNGILSPFTIELDGLDEDDYRTEINNGLYEYSKTGNVISSKCNGCGFVHIAATPETCDYCGSEDLETKATNEEWIVCDSEDVPSEYVGEYDLSSDFWNYNEFIKQTHLDPEIVAAGVYLGIDLDNIEEAYQGQYKDDEDFAQELAEEIGAIDNNASWPNYCIDWERAARDIMMDYCEHEGYYFRNL